MNKKYQIYFDHYEEEDEEEVLVVDKTNDIHKLVVWNDDFNTFDFVIDCLIKICKHTLVQAEQCTMLIHYKGKCVVKSGEMEILQPMHEKLTSKGLTSEVV
ncbi:MAG: Clp protease ClpS [Flavobacteriales bacterium]|nr:MAG: Clp protease ClpS [Flavobacteriales bacterium]